MIDRLSDSLLSAQRTRRQENAPTDASGVIGSIYDRMNEDLDDVVKLEINYVGGVIHRWGVGVGVLLCRVLGPFDHSPLIPFEKEAAGST